MFLEMAEAALAKPRDGREWFMFLSSGGAMLGGPWGPREVIETDVRQLSYVGLLKEVPGTTEGYVIPPAGIRTYGQLKRRQGDPVERVDLALQS
jgi:hypothetical protein